jgi:hydrogenase nickel incorporation protein HypA/HybF
MHELSIVMSIVSIAEEQATAARAQRIEEIELDIGCLSTIETEAFDFAWKEGIKNTALEKATCKINRIKGKGKCLDCETEFEINHYYDPCPVCGQHLVDIIAGKELRVKSLVIS